MNDDLQSTPFDYANDVASFMTRYGWTGEMLINFVRTDENNRVFNSSIALGALVDGLNAQNERDRAPQVLGHLQRALTPQPSGRWTPLITRRTTQLKRDITPRVTEALSALYRDPQRRPALWLKALIERCDLEIKALEHQRTEDQAQLRQTEKDLEPLQARINSFLQSNASRRAITHLIELFTALLQTVDKGVGLTAVVLMAERLVNDREAHALALDAATAAMGVLQEIRGQAQAAREQVTQFVARCRAVAQQLAVAKTQAQAQLAIHPYADISLAEDGLFDRLNHHLQIEPTINHLQRLVGLDEPQLYQAWYGDVLAQAQQQTASLSLLELMEMEAAAIQTREEGTAPGEDLVAATLATAYRRAGARVVELDRHANPADWWLVGVPDETNSGFAFEGATLVGTGRRDQIQFLHIEVGIAPQDLLAYAAAREPFEQAAANRNYYVFESLAMDDHARQVFAVGLASGVISVHGGAFVIEVAAITLGLTAEDALDQFAQHGDWVKTAEEQLNGLSLNVLIERLEAYLARGRSVQDELWWEFASYVRDRLELARHQQVFAANDR